jgi:mono/diheme cytochrome c family protein
LGTEVTLVKVILGGTLTSLLIFGAERVPAQAPVPTDEALINGGRQLFFAKCAACHGPNGKAQVGAMANAADLTRPQDFVRGNGDNDLSNTIQNGIGNSMPPFKAELTDSDITKIIAFIRRLQARAAASAAQ